MTKNVLYSGLISIVTFTHAVSYESVAQVTPQQVAMMKTVTNSIISDDGRYVAYTVSVPTDPKKDNLSSQLHLYVLNTSTGESKSLYAASSVGQLAIRPNSSSITFTTKEKDDKTNAVYEVSMNGGQAKKIFQYSSNISTYSWHPDGQQLGFVSAEKHNKPATSLNYSPTFFEEEFSDRNAYIINVNQPNDKKQISVGGGSVYMLQWSPDGSKIALSVAPTSSVDDSYMAQQVKVADPLTGKVIADIHNEGKLNQIEWSPDNSRLALVAGYDLYDPTPGSLHIVSAAGGKPVVIDKDYQGRYESITWASANDIYFLSSEGVGTTIGKIRPDGNNKSYIFKSDTHHITSFSLAVRNTAISFTANTPEHPSEVFTIEGKKAPVKRTDNNEWLKNARLGRQEIVTYRSRDKKYDIQGLLIYPLDYKAGTKYPLITVVHGGPEAHYSNGWLTAYSMPGQMGAAEGYAVFYPNYRGSTGRGIDFTYSSQADLAGKEFDDIVDGVDHLIAKGLADETRIGVTGGSYGGYASAWMSTYYSERFTAAVMFVGISNNISKFGTSDIPNEMFLVHSRKRIWDDWEWQLKRSPIYYVDRSNTPILIMHGAEDPRVHPAQSMELYRHLKVRKPEVPVRLIYYPGEGHGNARSGSRYDYNLRMMQWFDTYLKTGQRNAPLPNLDLPE